MHREVKSNELAHLFEELDRRLITAFYNFSLPQNKFEIVAVGGTALGLLNIKGASKDLDLIIVLASTEPLAGSGGNILFAQHLERFIKEYFDGSQGIGADISYEGLKSWNLLEFPMQRAVYSDQFKCFTLSILDPVDVCITKLARYDFSDIRDIKDIIERFKPNVNLLEARFAAYLPRLKNPALASYVLKNFEKLKEHITN